MTKMNVLRENVSLRALHTFGLDVQARYFVRIEDLADLRPVFELPHQKLILGGGSNLVFLQDYPGLIIHLCTKGIEVVDQNDTHVWVRTAAGENWHGFVQWCLEKNYGGLENLSLIPGTVGAAPIQNIGAYGVELESAFDYLMALDVETGAVQKFTREDCGFGYRNSVFKNLLKGRFCITEVVFKLTRKNHTLVLNYGAIKDQLSLQKIVAPTIQDVSAAVIAIRQSKLPDPKVLGNAGSFFKNPIVAKDVAAAIRKEFREMPFYDLGDAAVKIPAAWLIEQAGWKGKEMGGVGVYAKHALVLVNSNNGTSEELRTLISEIKESVKARFNIGLEIEVNLVG